MIAAKEVPTPATSRSGEAPPARGMSAWSGIGLTFLLCIVFIHVANRPLSHREIWGHLKFGQWICRHHSLPEQAPFPPEATNAPVDHYSWLAQVGFYAAYAWGECAAGSAKAAAGGVEALRLLHGSLAVACLSLLFWAFVRVSGSALVAILGLLLTAFLGVPDMEHLRPQNFSEVLFALMLVALSRPQLSTGAFFLLPLAIALWGNIHGSFLIGLLVMGGANGGQFLQACREAGGVKLRAVWRYDPFRRLFCCIMLSLLMAGLLNPAGFHVYPAAFAYRDHPAVAAQQEWQHLTWNSSAAAVFLLSILWVAFSYMAGMFLLPRNESPRMLLGGIPLGQMLLLLFFGLRTLGCLRFLPWWVCLTVWISMNVWGPLWRRLGAEASWRLRPGFSIAICVVLALGALMLSGVGIWLWQGEPCALEATLDSGTPRTLAAQWLAPDSRALVPLQPWLQTHEKEMRKGRIFTTESLGDYLLWTLPPENAPLLFSQVQLYPADYWTTTQQILSGSEDWLAKLDRLGAVLLVIEAEEYPELRRQVMSPSGRQHWSIILDEHGNLSKNPPASRLFIAVRN